MHPEVGAPGKIAAEPNAGAIPPLHAWEPEYDALQPGQEEAGLYVPTIVAVPPQLPLPRHERPEYPARNVSRFLSDTSAADHAPSALGFTAHTVRVDNYSNQWVYLPSLGLFIAPYNVNGVYWIRPGTTTAHWMLVAPAGWSQAAIPAGGPQAICTFWYEDELAPVGGTVLAQLTVQ